MKRKEFKENLFAALDNDVDDITYDEKMVFETYRSFSYRSR